MSLANWTTRFLVGNATDGENKAETQEGNRAGGDTALGAAAGDGARTFVGSRVGSYLVSKRLGAGGVGEVFKGLDVLLEREVAIKVLRDELAADPNFVARFRNEAQLHAKLSHPNVARVHAFLEEGDKLFMVMEYVPGISLDEFVRSGGPVPVERALHIFRRALDGIAHAHGHGIVHRDIKPANIMLTDSGDVKVMDFGIARAMDSQEHLTRHGHVAGTAKAMSPEQIRGRPADVRSDVYSLGIVLYTLLAGRPPFDDANDLALMKAQLEQAPPPLHALVAELPAQVEAAVMRALQKDPAARFQSVHEFAAAIDACTSALDSIPARSLDELDRPTVSRTIVNPALLGVKRMPPVIEGEARPMPAPGGSRRLPWLGIGAGVVAVGALTAAVGWMWSLLAEPSASVADAATVSTSAPSQVASTLPPTAAASAPAPKSEPPPAVMSSAPAPAATTADTTLLSRPAPTAPVATPPSLTIVRAAGNRNVGSGVREGVSTAAAADRLVKPGERIRLHVTTGRDAHVYCYLQDETKRIVRFYPNRFSAGARVKAAEPLELPGKMRFELVANSLKVPETVACFASDRDLGRELPAAVYGTDFAKLNVESLDEVRRAFARIAPDALAEGRFQLEFK